MPTRTRFDVPTPALLVDRAALDRNIARMAAFFATGACRLRPHFKAHKTPEIARRQLAAGSCTGLTCATVGEAEVAAAVCTDILVANEVVTAGRAARLAALARRLTMTVAVDSDHGVRVLSAAARTAGITLGVLVDVNVGQMRCGVEPGAGALALARAVHDTPGLTLRGVMGYEGHLQAVPDRAERTSRARAAMEALVETATQLRAAGLPCDIVSGGGTGTYDISGRVAGVTEIQAGSYALMDTDYARVGVPFEQAFSVLGTVVSRPAPDRAVADCGHKAATPDHGLPTVKGLEGAIVTALNDEHVVIAVPEGCPLGVGDLLELWPSHTDPTINLHDALYVLDGDQVVDRWTIAARGYPEQREPA
ncbi:MAG: DSD1 family PLP-dependent enzyme [Vicinamibacterales bacterium]